MPKRKVFLAVRMEPKDIEMLTKVAQMHGITRSQLLRELATNAGSLYTYLRSERRKKQSEGATISEELTQRILDTIPEDMIPEWLEILSDALTEIVQIKRDREEKEK